LRRAIIWILTIVLIGAVAVLALRRGSARVATGDAEVNTEGHFLSDSLGVTLLLPPSKGWRFDREASVSGGPYVSAVRDDERANVRLFVAQTQPTSTIESVVENRREQFAAYFGVDSLSTVVGRVMQEEMVDQDGHPVWQWQSITHPLTMQDGKQSRIMFMWMATVRPDNVYECIAMLLIPMGLLPEEQREYDVLMQDLAFIMQSFRIR